MRFCDCDAKLDIIPADGEYSFHCPRCEKTTIGTDEGTLISHSERTNISYDTMIAIVADDPTIQIIDIPCVYCKNKYMAVMIVGDAQVTGVCLKCNKRQDIVIPEDIDDPSILWNTKPSVVDYTTKTKKPTKKVTVVGSHDEMLTIIMEPDMLFRKWLEASRAQIIDSKYKKILSDDFMNNQNKYLDTGKFYDPNNGIVSEYLVGIDHISKYLWYQYRPPPQDVDVIPKLEHTYKLKITHPSTSKHKNTMTIFEDSLIRRYYGIRGKAVTIISLSDNIERIYYNGSDSDVITIKQITKNIGTQINKYIWKQMTKSHPDLIVIDMRDPKDTSRLIIDSFIPAYPIFITKDVIVLTLILFRQINGIDPLATKRKQIIQSIINRTSYVLGAMITTDSYSPVDITPDAKYHRSGISSLSDGIYTNGKVLPVYPQDTHFVSPCDHGWLTTGTKATLLTAIEIIKPTKILECGSWYGLSASFIKKYAPDAHLTCIDYFKNNANYDIDMDELSPSDKLFQQHLRLETFHRNIAIQISKNKKLDDKRYSGTDISVDDIGVTTIQMSILDGLELLSDHDFDMVYIDCEKKTKPLISLLKTIRKMCPGAIIVGDDYRYGSVKKAINLLMKGAFHGSAIVVNDESYIISPEKSMKISMVDIHTRKLQECVAPPKVTELIQLIDEKKYHVAIETISDPLHYILPDEIGTNVLNVISKKTKLTDDKWDKIMGDTDSWTQPVINPAKLTPFDYQTHHITFE
jgi:hypothetical protein|uniref:Methyltransferase n=1 Tax=viral metagenome TaxID=1070528 RepID=A0A6C0IUL3_9ZZZZ